MLNSNKDGVTVREFHYFPYAILCSEPLYEIMPRGNKFWYAEVFRLSRNSSVSYMINQLLVDRRFKHVWTMKVFLKNRIFLESTKGIFSCDIFVLSLKMICNL